MELKIAGDTDQQDWDAIVERSPNATLFHTWKWLKLMEKNSAIQNNGIISQVTFHPLFLIDKDRTVGIFPLFFFKNILYNFTYSPPPNSEILYLGPLFPDLEIVKEEKKQILINNVQKEIDRYIKKDLSSAYIQVSTSPGYEDCRSFKWAGYIVSPRYSYEIDLMKGKESVWNEFPRKLKYEINSVKKKGFSVEIGTRKDLEFIYDLLKERNRINADKKYILEIFETFSPQNLKVFILKYEGKNISGIVFISYKKRGWIWIGNPRPLTDGPSPNNLLLWEVISYAVDCGLERLENIGADDYFSFPFKRRFNGKIIPYYQMRWLSQSLKVFSAMYHFLNTGQKTWIDE